MWNKLTKGMISLIIEMRRTRNHSCCLCFTTSHSSHCYTRTNFTIYSNFYCSSLTFPTINGCSWYGLIICIKKLSLCNFYYKTKPFFLISFDSSVLVNLLLTFSKFLIFQSTFLFILKYSYNS